eukprot:3363354-Pyramimonas_sp.AAC.1
MEYGAESNVKRDSPCQIENKGGGIPFIDQDNLRCAMYGVPSVLCAQRGAIYVVQCVCETNNVIARALRN